MSSSELTERQKREKEYYDQFAQSFDIGRAIDLSPITSTEERPWNSYWSVYHIAAKKFKPGQKLLDFGSGPGDNAFRFSKIGYSVEGFDISESNVAVSKMLFKTHGSDGNFQVSSAEKLPYEDNFFNFIAGVDILHHVEIKSAVEECRRVLKSGGIAVFREPIEVPFLDYIRNLSLVKMFAPKEKSFEYHITEDEKKLTSRDIEIIRGIFPDMVIQRYFFLARFDRFFRKGSDPAPSFLEKVDHILFKIIPPLKYFGGAIVFTLKKE